MDGTQSIGSEPLITEWLSTGIATFSTSSLAAGTHSITAIYSGDTLYNTSVSTAITQVVNMPVSTTTTLTSSSNSSVYGQSATFTATVTPSSGTGSTPTGMVTFYDNGVPFTNGTNPFPPYTPTPVNVQLVDGVATFTPGMGYSNLAVGTNAITAVYNGTIPYMGGSDPPYGRIRQRPSLK